MNQDAQPAPPKRIECAASRDPAVRWFIFAAMMIGFAGYTVYDHYIAGNFAYPEPYELNGYLKYLFNHYIPHLLFPLGLVALYVGIRHLRRTLTADEDGIGFAGKPGTAWSDVVRLDASRWDSKGILVLHLANGRKLTLDEWKLDKANFRNLVAFVEAHVSADAMDKP